MKSQPTRVIRFLISGGTAAAVEYMLFSMIIFSLGSGTLHVAQTISFIAGLLVSFSLNNVWVFNAQGDTKKIFLKYIILAAINLLIGNILITIGSQLIPVYVAKLLVMAIIAIWNYVIFQKFIFK